MPTGSSAEYVVHGVAPTNVAQQVKPQQRPVLFQCSVCLDSARDVAVTPCGHVFCYQCHMQCAERRSMYRCAVCRAEVRVSQVRTRMPVLNAMITEAIAYAERNNVAALSDVRAMLPCVMAMMATVQQQVGVEKGTEICGFITPGKTFLDSRYDTYIAAEAHYRPPLPDMYSAVIDLTNTARYYNGRALGACYHKIKCKGHNQCPSPRAVKAFIDTVVAAPGLVYVHCTYGFNRTGYLICCYLVECRKMSVHDAIRLFAEARPPGMYKADYIKTLCVKYNARVLAVPSNLPSWLPEQVVVTHTASGPKAARHVLRCISVEDPVLAAEIVRVVATTVGYPYTDQFAGCMPVSMSKHNYASILCLKDDARATWKADGVRYMMYIDGKDRVYVIDRCAHVSRLTADVFVGPDGMHLVDTLVDCEYTSNGTMYIFDAVYVRGVYVCDAPLDSRLASVQCVAQAHRGPMSVRVKCSVGIGDFELLYSTYADRSDCDGFIFQSNSRPYYGGRDVQIIKYKPVHKNTVDFMLVPSDAQCAGLYLHNDTTPFAQVSAWDPAMAGRVVECAYVNGTWSVLRVRADKSQANTRVTALRVYESIIHPVDFDLFRETISLAMLF